MNDQWARSSEYDPEVLEESALAMAQATVQKAMSESGTSKAELARRLERPRSFISRLMSGSHNLTVKTMARALVACGYEIEFGMTPIRWNWMPEEANVSAVILDCEEQVPALEEGTLLSASINSRAAGCSPLVLGVSTV